MKLLYLSGALAADYQCDMLFHGLRELLGADIVDAERLWFMYQPDVTPSVAKSLYGRGFTVYGRLPGLAVDRSDIEAKLRARYFDYVVYGSAWRSLNHLPLVLESYPADRIAFVDGEDGQSIRTNLLPLGLYFKRECTRASTGCIPINFAIPKSAIRAGTPPKQKAVATVIPGRPETYIFHSEEAYYDDYAASLFAITTKKAGWDCLRHYEILANGCIPFFLDIERCPSHTMLTMPKRFLRAVHKWRADPAAIPPQAFEACRRFAAAHLTTQVLATAFLDALRTGRRRLPCTDMPL